MMFPPAPGQLVSEAEAVTEERHKERSNWFRERAAYPFREADPDPLIQYRVERKAAGPSPHAWQPLGPNNFCGRITSLAVDPRQPDRIFAGSAAGGVWRSEDGGGSWKSLWSQQETLNVGSLAIDPENPDFIFCGTGEANLSSDSYPGAGLYFSRNGGDDWELIVETSGVELFPRRIGSLAVKPRSQFNPRTDTADTIAYVYLGSVTHADDDFSRLVAVRVKPDTAVTEFPENFVSGQNYWVHHVMMHPGGQLFVTVQARGALSGIWRSDELGSNFEHLQKGLPSADRFGRVSLAFAPSKSSVLYALAEDLRGRVLGVFRSQDAGNSWRDVTQMHFRRESQISYNNCIAVDPEDHNIVYCGCINLHRSRNGGRDWERLTNWRLPRRHKRYIHGDCHAIAIPRHGRIYVATDGGIFRSDNGGDTWSGLHHGLQTTMFYDIDVAPSEGKIYGGGSQDNGVLVHTGQDDSANFVQVLSGDGGWTLFDPEDPFHLWASTQHMSLHRLMHGKWRDVTPPQASDEEKAAVWLSSLAMDDKRVAPRPRAVFAGSTRVWRTLTDGINWSAVSRNLDGSEISAIEVASADSRMVYVGTTRGGFYRSTDGGDTWSENLAGPELPGRMITRIEAHPQDARLVVVTVGQTPRDRRIIVQLPKRGGALSAVSSRFPHVFVSRDGGLSWASGDLIPQGTRQLPDVPFNALTFETQEPFRVFLAGDAGVFEGWLDPRAPVPVALAAENLAGEQVQSFGAPRAEAIAWKDISGCLPNVPVADLVYHRGTGALFAATFGRAIWQLKLTG